jgi:hypothetical protein
VEKAGESELAITYSNIKVYGEIFFGKDPEEIRFHATIPEVIIAIQAL